MRGLRVAVATACGAALACAQALPAAAAGGSRGTVTVLAHVPAPGYPADPRVVGDTVYEGTYDNPYGDTVASRVFAFSAASGALVRTYVVSGQDLSKPHGVQVAAVDSRGNLILLDKTSGRILRLDPRTGAQSLYGQVADLKQCDAASVRPPCSPTMLDLAPMPDYAVWGPDGSLYVTDYQQAVIWRLPPGGGEGRIWLASRRLDGAIFGTAGLAIAPDHRTLLFDQGTGAGLGAGNPTTGALYSVPIEPDGGAGPLRELWQSYGAAVPDGFAVAASGDIYLAEVGLTNQIVELSPAGRPIATFGQAFTGEDGSSVPFDSPSGVAWLGTELVIANQSYLSDDASNQALLELQTGEPGAAAYVPADAGYVVPAVTPKPARKPAKKRSKHPSKRHPKPRTKRKPRLSHHT
jgi:sugar lactone lactonase YvrE